MKKITDAFARCENSCFDLYEIAQDLNQENEDLKKLLERYLKIESTIPTNASIQVAELTKDVLKELRK